MVLLMAFLASLMVQRKLARGMGLAYLGLFASLLVGYVYAKNHAMFELGSPVLSLAGSCR
jgi:hypothetical protein